MEPKIIKNLPKKREDVKKIVTILKSTYPQRKTSLRFNNPLNLLVATILSAQCTDKMVNKIAPYLFKKYKNVEDYADMDIKDFMKEIRSIGLYRSKAKNIKRMAGKIIAEFKGRVPDSIDSLIQLPGVGRKTANIVLSNAFNKSEGIAVDTHVKRVSKRLGLTDRDEPVKIELDLMNIVPKRYWGIFNHLLVAHGRSICRARNPLHSICVIKNYCKWYRKNIDEKAQ